MKKILNILFIAFLLCIYIYICFIDNLPKNITLFKGENIELPKILGITWKDETNKENSILTSSNFNDNTVGAATMDVRFLDLVTLKSVDINVIERKKVIPIGQVAGLKLYTNGVLVVGMSEINGEDGKKYKPYENVSIKEGDMIEKVNDEDVIDTENLLKIINESQGEEIKITYVRENNYYNENIKPIKTKENEYKIGIWVRDSAAGIGTMTYYEPSTGNFAALGHGITDIDTGNLINISNGEFLTTDIISIVKGLKGSPGKIQGTIDEQPTIGTIYKNTEIGIYGKVTNEGLIKENSNQILDVAKKEEIQLGEAKILCSLDGTMSDEYTVEIKKIFINNDYDNKSILLKVTDEELLSKTGGIIQGMSGSPVIQNNKFIGAITNVLVNDPTQGYAIFGEMMLREAEK